MIKRLFLAACWLAFLVSCQDILEQELDTGSIEAGKRRYGLIYVTKTPFSQELFKPILADDEPDSILFNNSLRSFVLNRPLQVGIEDQKLYFRFYSPRKIRNVRIWGSIEGYDEEFKVAEFEEIPPYTEFSQLLPMINEDYYYQTITGKEILVMKNPYLSEANLKIRIECEDPFYKKVTDIPSTVRVEFGKYSGEGSWKSKILPAHCREGIAFIMNMMYMYSHERFQEEFEKRTYYSDAKYTKEIPHAQLKSRLLNVGGVNRLHLGHVTGVDGLGGGATFGIAEWQFLKHYADDDADPHVFFHEYAHCMGYGHPGNMTYDNKNTGFNSLCGKMYRELSLSKELPVYSRRFLHTRRYGKFYGQPKYFPSKNVIEDPELDALDGGLDIKVNLGDIEDTTIGQPLNFTLDYRSVPGATQNTFIPKDVCVNGNRIYVLNDADGNPSVEMFSENNGVITHQKTLKRWSYKDAEMTFAGVPQGIAFGEGKLYVNGMNSRTDVFDEDMNYITSIGTGKWGDGMTQLVHGFETLAKGGLVVIKDKRRINLFYAEDMVEKDRMKIARIASSAPVPEDSNTYGLDMDKNGYVYQTQFNLKKVYVFSLNSFRFGDNLKPVRTLNRGNKAPYDVVCVGDRIFVTQNAEPRLVELDATSGEEINSMATLLDEEGIVNPQKMCVARGNLFVVDRTRHYVKAISLTRF